MSIREPNQRLAAAWRQAWTQHGHLLTFAETARILGAPRQTVHFWATCSKTVRLTPVYLAGDPTRTPYVPAAQVMDILDKMTLSTQLHTTQK